MVAGLLESQILTQIDRPMPGLENMALDESMLDRIPPGISAMVRVYRWSEPTLSLGHFQSMPNDETAPWSKLPQVTRKTGGGAIVHHHEMTYCLAVTSSSAAGKKGHSDKLYRAVHNSIVDALRGLGWNAQLSETCTCNLDSAAGSSPFLCFDRRSPVDVVIDGKKIAGSAQRRTARGLLQHGSILLRSSEHAPHLPGILEIGQSGLGDEPKLSLRKDTSPVSDPSRAENAKPGSLDSQLNEEWFVEIVNRGLHVALS
jgi:lipoate-protein ligase A